MQAVDKGTLLLQFVSQRAHFLLIIRQMFAGQFGGFPHAHDQRHAFRATSPVALLVPALDQWRKRRFAPDVQRANTFRRVKLVARKRKVVHRNLSDVNLHLARCLHRVAVIEHASRLANFRDPFDREQQ